MSKYMSNTFSGQTSRCWDTLANDLLYEVKTCTETSKLSKSIKDRLEAQTREVRREVNKKTNEGCTALFHAAKRGNVEIAEYLVTVCEANIEQRGLFEVHEERTIHLVTPLWCAAVSGKLAMVRLLIRLGSFINALSDTGSTPVRSSCFMTYIDIVKFLIENGADIRKANYNGGTCLINSVQSVELCTYLIEKGADVNARDIQDKTALHYAVQEQRLETSQLLLKHGSNPLAKSRYGDDALTTACLKGAHQIFDFLKNHIQYEPEQIANAHELIGSTFLDEHNESRVAILHWRMALHIRLRSNVPKVLVEHTREAFGYAREFTTTQELDNIAMDMDQMRVQSLLICERILGITHKDMLFRLMYRGASYADSLRFQNCLNLWILLLEIRISKNSILHSDTSYTAQAIIRLMLDLHDKYIANEFPNGQDLPYFKDIFKVFALLTSNVLVARNLLLIQPVHKKQQENFDKILKCITHLIYLLISKTDLTHDENKQIVDGVTYLIQNEIRSSITQETLLHLCVSRLNSIKHGYITATDNSPRSVFPNFRVVELMLKCGADVNARNEARSTPLLVASITYNIEDDILKALLSRGAHLDQPNRKGDRPLKLILENTKNKILVMNYLTLKCLAATIITKYRIPYKNQVPATLEDFVKLHETQ